MSNSIHCSGCDRDLDFDDFSWKNKAKATRQRWCKECQREANKAHYQNNMQVYKDRAMTRNTRVIAMNRQKLYDYLSTHPCVDCSVSDIRFLQFDHIQGDKKDSIARMIGTATSWESIVEEIAKCEVRCANCHSVKTSERGGWWRHHL